MMDRPGLLKAVAPCSLLCYTCFGYKDGAVSYHAGQLFELHKGWYEGHELAYGDNPSAEQMSKLDSIRTFNEMLKGLMNPTCRGCRECSGRGGGCIAGCIIPQCTQQHGVEYCGDCSEFPCDRNNAIFPPNVLKKWLEGSSSIRENGIESYFEESRLVAHYIEFYVDR